MAAEIHPSHKTFETETKMQLLNKLEGHQDTVNGAVIFDDEEGVLSISNDKSIRIWIKRDNGNYWPSVCFLTPAAATCFSLDQTTKKLFVGMENGTIIEFLIGEDYNKLTREKIYKGHDGKINDVLYVPQINMLFTGGKDKYVRYYSTESSNLIGSSIGNAACTSLQFDLETSFLFVGSALGEIVLYKLKNGLTKTTVLKVHSNAIRCLTWDPKKQMLYSASNDQMVICWDIGGKKGTAFELSGHSGKISSVCLAKSPQLLLSGSEDHMVLAWNMKVQREETPEWKESDNCQRCERPFFWNIKSMVDQKKIGLRQHHCRRCGKAVCDSCSSNQSQLPKFGFEFKVRVCDDCFLEITDQDRVSLARIYDTKHCIVSMSLNENKQQLVTCGTDKLIKIWNASKLFKYCSK